MYLCKVYHDARHVVKSGIFPPADIHTLSTFAAKRIIPQEKYECGIGERYTN